MVILQPSNMVLRRRNIERPSSPGRLQPGRAYWQVLAFMGVFVIILLLVVYRYLLPAFSAADAADATARKQLAAISSLVLAVVLFALLAILMLILRPGRFLFPGKTLPRVQTRYQDAWAESARRMEAPPPDKDEA